MSGQPSEQPGGTQVASLAAFKPSSRNHLASVRASSEHAVGVIHFVSPVDYGWHGDIRKRYTDFLVNEIRKDGQVLHLQDYEVVSEEPNRSPSLSAAADQAGAHTASSTDARPAENNDGATIADEDVALLQRVLGENITNKLIQMYSAVISGNRRAASGQVVFNSITDRSQRGVIHRDIRRIFASRIDTQTDNNGIITAIATNQRGQRNARRGGSGGQRIGQHSRTPQVPFSQLGGDYLHFTLYKENKDTMDAINHIARTLKIKATYFGFAGTKDRRAATVQRVSVYKVRSEQMKWLNGKMPAIKAGDFAYHEHPIKLGNHGGNQFVITVKNCYLARASHCSLPRRLEMMEHAVRTALDNTTKNGFINYFGLQRFGTHTVGTQEVGTMILQGDFEGAVNAVLHVDKHLHDLAMSGENIDPTASNRDELGRAKAILTWRNDGDADAALRFMPKRFSAETSIIRHLSRSHTSQRDFCGALMTITRGMRMMYIHAYQSLVWNHVASERWARYGSKVVKGDLIFVDQNDSVVRGDIDDMTDDPFRQRARPLTAEEAAGGNYSIFDIVLPTPGYEVVYPDNEIGEFYVEFMARQENGGLDPYNMRRSQREFSLSGTYRRLIARFVGTPSFEVRAYSDENVQLHDTDLDLIKQRKGIQSMPAKTAPKTSTGPVVVPAEQKAPAAPAKKEELLIDFGEDDVADTPAQLGTVQAWASFARNARNVDKEMAMEIRRDREVRPAVETTVKTTWIQTSLDVSSKRIKVDEHRYVANSSGEISVPSFGRSAGRVAGPSKPSRQPTVPGVQETAGFAGPAKENVPSDGLGHKTDLDLLGAQPDQAPKSPAYVEEPPNYTPPANFLSPEMQQSSAYTWKAASRAGSPSAAADVATVLNSASAGTKRSGQDITGAVAGERSELTEDMGIAVVLKFGLGTSSYATIALRELMGAVIPESKEASPVQEFSLL